MIETKEIKKTKETKETKETTATLSKHGEITSELQLNDVRLQFKEEGEVDGGYNLIWNYANNDVDYIIFIDHTGTLNECPLDF